MITAFAFVVLASQAARTNLAINPSFDIPDSSGKAPAGYTLAGNARWAWVGYSDETRVHGVALNAFASGKPAEGEVSQMVTGIDASKGKWLTFSFRGRAEDGFTLGNDVLQMKIGFYSKGGTNYMDSGQRLIYREILRDRKDFAVNGDDKKSGAVVWRTYRFEELMPFAEVDSVKLTIQFKNGTATSDKASRFFIQDFSLTQNPTSLEGKKEPKAKETSSKNPTSTDGMISLGGRWFYLPKTGENVAVDAAGKLTGSLRVNYQNADRLFYKDDRLENPFAENMTAWLERDTWMNGETLSSRTPSSQTMWSSTSTVAPR